MHKPDSSSGRSGTESVTLPLPSHMSTRCHSAGFSGRCSRAVLLATPTFFRVVAIVWAVALSVPFSRAAAPDPVVLRLDGAEIRESEIKFRSQKGEELGTVSSSGPGLGRLAARAESLILRRGVDELGIVASQDEVRARIQSMRPGLGGNPDELLKRERDGNAAIVRALRMARRAAADQERIYREVVKDGTGYSYEMWQEALKTFATEERIAALEAAAPSTVEDIYRAAWPAAERWVLREKLVDQLVREAATVEPTDAAILSHIRAQFGNTYTEATVTPTLRASARRSLVATARRDAYAKWVQRRFSSAKLEILDPRLGDAVRALQSYWWKE